MSDYEEVHGSTTTLQRGRGCRDHWRAEIADYAGRRDAGTARRIAVGDRRLLAHRPRLIVSPATGAKPHPLGMPLSG